MTEYSPRGAVRTTKEPMTGLYDVVVSVHENPRSYLVRFTGLQQVFYTADELQAWA